MKTKDDTPATSNPPPATAAEQPIFDQATAIWQEPPYRHEPSARTVAWHQPLPDGRTALLTATGQFIAVQEASASPLNSSTTQPLNS